MRLFSSFSHIPYQRESGFSRLFLAGSAILSLRGPKVLPEVQGSMAENLFFSSLAVENQKL
jgi:hypothetical protein